MDDEPSEDIDYRSLWARYIEQRERIAELESMNAVLTDAMGTLAKPAPAFEHEGTSFTMRFHLISDSGMEVKMELNNIGFQPNLSGSTVTADTVVKMLNANSRAAEATLNDETGWRFMTKDEIKKSMREKEDGEDEYE